MKHVLATLAALAAIATPVFAVADDQERPPMSASALATVTPRVDRFVEALKANDAQGAINGIVEGSLLRERTAELAQLVAQTTLMVANTGTVQSAELMDSDCATARYCRVRYVVYGDRTAMGLWLYLYEGEPGDWIVMSVLMGEAPPFFFND